MPFYEDAQSEILRRAQDDNWERFFRSLFSHAEMAALGAFHSVPPSQIRDEKCGLAAGSRIATASRQSLRAPVIGIQLSYACGLSRVAR
jgi:hypothetical protein